MEDKINGIEFLNSKEVPTKKKLNWEFAWKFFSMYALVIFAIAAIPAEVTNLLCNVVCEYSFFERIVAYIIAAMILPIPMGILGLMCKIPIEYETVYNVAVLDESSIVELKKNYEIIKQKGKLYTVRKNNKIKGCKLWKIK